MLASHIRPGDHRRERITSAIHQDQAVHGAAETYAVNLAIYFIRRLFNDADYGLVNFFGILLAVVRMRVIGFVKFLCLGEYFSPLIDHKCLGTGGTDINCEDLFQYSGLDT